jgi:uncharacterized protein
MSYYSFNNYLKERFGERVQKITLDAGMTCPNRDGTKGVGGCVYCDSRGSGNDGSKKHPDIKTQVVAGKNFLSKRYKAKKFIAYFQSYSNTYASTERLRQLYDQAVSVPGVVGLSVATRPDCLTEEVLEIISAYSDRLMVWLELGMQTSCDATLKRINRGHTYKEFVNGFKLARKYPVQICVHAIIGLPGEQKKEMLVTAKELAALKPDGVKIHSLYVSKNTELENMYYRKEFVPLSQEEFVNIACDYLELLPEKTVIHRLTGDPAPNELVAPHWTLDKNQTLKLIAEEMNRRQSRQGKL